MIDALLERATTRLIFVVGKGGVGKTTTSGALALGLADRGTATHLISTDPAHSLDDLFQGESCSNHLTIESFDARKFADSLFQTMRGPLTELIERGTYLDAADAASFLDLSIPGIDEVMSALRLVELFDSSAERIVVDTAPTGHTLRLLDSGSVIESWADAGRAMSAKVAAVSSALVGRAVHLEAESLLEGWRNAAKRFDTSVVRASSAIIITREGSVVEAETTRLTNALQKRGLATAATVLVGDANAGHADFVIARSANARGCHGLRHMEMKWTQRSQRSQRTQRTQRSRRPAGPREVDGGRVEDVGQALPPQFDRKLIWVAGKGGVGKSTCASAIASALANEKRVCLVSTDPAGSLSEILDVEIGADTREVAPGLFARQIDAVAEYEKLRDQFRGAVNDVFASLGLDESAQLDRRVIESMWDFAPPGIDEIISLIEILQHADAYDVMVIDSAPTGHFLRLIELPEIALEWVRSLLRLLVKYGAVASLDALAQDLLAFAKRLKELKLQLSTPGTTAVFVVTLDEPMVSAETARLSSALAAAGIPVAGTILNRADDGREHRQRWIRAPDQHREIVGAAALRSFLAQWDFNE